MTKVPDFDDKGKYKNFRLLLLLRSIHFPCLKSLQVLRKDEIELTYLEIRFLLYRFGFRPLFTNSQFYLNRISNVLIFSYKKFMYVLSDSIRVTDQLIKLLRNHIIVKDGQLDKFCNLDLGLSAPMQPMFNNSSLLSQMRQEKIWFTNLDKNNDDIDALRFERIDVDSPIPLSSQFSNSVPLSNSLKIASSEILRNMRVLLNAGRFDISLPIKIINETEMSMGSFYALMSLLDYLDENPVVSIRYNLVSEDMEKLLHQILTANPYLINSNNRIYLFNYSNKNKFMKSYQAGYLLFYNENLIAWNTKIGQSQELAELKSIDSGLKNAKKLKEFLHEIEHETISTDIISSNVNFLERAKLKKSNANYNFNKFLETEKYMFHQVPASSNLATLVGEPMMGGKFDTLIGLFTKRDGLIVERNGI